MQLDTDRIWSAFTLYSGEEPEEDSHRSALCRRLCTECAAQVQLLAERLEGPEAQQHLAALESWAAAEAFYQLTLADEACRPEQITADGVTVTEGKRSQKARALAAEKRLALLPVLGEEAFYFGRV